MRMKTLRHILPLLPLALLAACSNDLVLPDTPAGTPDGAGITTITAYAPGAGQAATRTTLGPQDDNGSYPVLWNDGDAIAVKPIGEETNTYWKFTTAIADGGTAASAEFALDDGEEMPTSSYGYCAFYPHGICNEIKTYVESKNVTFVYTVPSEQTAVAGSFESGINPTFAYTTDLEKGLKFMALNTLLKFRLKGEVVSELASVKLEVASKNARVSGKMDFQFTMQDDESLKFSCSSSYNDFSYSYITLVPEADEMFQEGMDYYMVIGLEIISAFRYEGFTLTFTKQDGTAFIKSGGAISSSNSLGRIINLGEIDLNGASWQ